MINGSEVCDGADLGGSTCESRGYVSGELGCADDCMAFDESECITQICGDGLITGDEVCDGAALNDETCESQGFFAGELACAEDCSGFEVAACTNCGNDVVDELEVCDGLDLAEETCMTLGYDGGELSCAASCDNYEEANCLNWWSEDFESGTLGPEWVSNAPSWFVTNQQPHAGTYTARSASIGHNSTTSMQVTLNFVQAGSVTFWYRVSSEYNWDYLRFYVNNSEEGAWSGTVGWNKYEMNLPAGQHTLRWRYSKDNSVSSGSDRAWIDDIVTVGAVLP